jgi:ApaG protein
MCPANGNSLQFDKIPVAVRNLSVGWPVESRHNGGNCMNGFTMDSKHHIQVRVRTAFVDNQSEPDDKRYVFAYTITITNDGSVPAKLLTRHWVITDANERVQEVRGVGVVGEQPHLSPGMSFEYTSGAVLETPFGTMQGSYQMQADDGTTFAADIPPFLLTVPRQLH